jgi:hypothetical protein
MTDTSIPVKYQALVQRVKEQKPKENESFLLISTTDEDPTLQ